MQLTFARDEPIRMETRDVEPEVQISKDKGRVETIRDICGPIRSCAVAWMLIVTFSHYAGIVGGKVVVDREFGLKYN